jgi:hypothetical protein
MTKPFLRKLGGVLLFAAVAAPPLTLIGGLLIGLARAYGQA